MVGEHTAAVPQEFHRQMGKAAVRMGTGNQIARECVHHLQLPRLVELERKKNDTSS